MPKVWKCPKSPRRENDNHFFTLAICTMGDRHYGPPTTRKEAKFLIVAIDFFMKWVEAEALTTIKEVKVQNFVWKNIVCKFEIPRTIVSDNGRQFDSHGFRLFCSSLGIKNKYSSPGHP